jgi:hypothetical protein
MAAGLGSVLTGMGVAALTLLSWVALNFFGKPIMTLRDKRREALEIAERYAYVGLNGSPSEEYQTKALAALNDAGNSLRAHFRERALARRIYSGVLTSTMQRAPCSGWR